MRIHVCGEEAGGRRVRCWCLQDFDALRRSGVTLQNGELHALLKLVVADPHSTLRGLVDAGKQRSRRA